MSGRRRASRTAAWALAVLLFDGSPAPGQPPAGEVGTPFIANFSPRDHGQHSQSWAAVQDQRGVMYFGNGNGVLELDGVDWRLIPVTNRSIVRSLAVDGDGTVYVGAVGELGYLRPDDSGQLGYVSLVDRLDAEDRSFSDVWRTWATDQGVFFWSRDKLLRWHGQRFESWTIDSDRVPCLVGGELFHNEKGVGLTVLRDGAFEDVEGGSALADVEVMMMLPHGEDDVLVGSRDGELRLLRLSRDPELAVRLERFDNAAAEYLAQHQLYAGARLPGGDHALATITGGLIVIDREGGIRHRFTDAEGLADESVWGLYVDREKGLWLALNRGIARIEITSPVTTFTEATGLEGTVEALTRFEGTLFVATSLGLYRLADRRAEEISHREAPYWSLLAHRDPADGRERLLVGGVAGVYEIRGDRLAPVLRTRNAFVLYASPGRPGVVYVGDIAGVSLLELSDGKWLDVGRLEGVDHEVRSIHEDGDGRLWLGTHFDGVLRLELDPGARTRVAGRRQFGLEHGLPALRSVKILPFEDRLLFTSPSGLVQLDPHRERFEASALFGPKLADGSTGVLRLVVDRDANAWMSLYETKLAVAFRQPDGSYALDEHLLGRIADYPILAVLPEPDGIVWLGGTEGLFRFDTTLPAASAPPREPPFPAVIRRVSVARPEGVVLYGGAAVAPWEPPVLPYARSAVRFEYALPRFDGREANRYRSRLVGLDDAWSAWTGETYRDFTALREGRYRFEVQGRDVYRRPSAAAVFELRILPPWYRTWWAYAGYALALAAAAWAFHRRQLKRARLEMELERLEEANAILQRSEQERQQFVRDLEAKNAEMERFIYTVSHDLKSPLISIRGFLGMLEKDMAQGQESRMRHDMERIHAATGKMAELVEELLELSKVGRVSNEPQVVSMTALASDVVDQVAGLIAESGVEVAIDPHLPAAEGDRQRLLAMLQNLVENAIKYMGGQPRPRIDIGHREQDGETVYQVRDNGMGIDPRYHDKIFGLFERLHTDVDGTGIGLALVKRIVEVHGGRIWVESEGEGRGSTFCFTLPRAPGTPAAPREGESAQV